jgi:hypothetical protein
MKLPPAASTLHRFILAAVLSMSAAAPHLPAESAAAPDRTGLLRLLEEAQGLFHRGSNTQDPQQAELLYRRALDRFLSVSEQGQVQNARLYYNMGNTYYRLGDIGRAVLYYRRAELMNPADRNLRHNLEFVRSQREDGMPVGQLSRLARVLFFWHYLLSPSLRLYLFAAAFACTCTAAAFAVLRAGGLLPARRKSRRGRPGPALGAVGAVTLLLLASLIAGEVRLRTLRDGVIVAGEVVIRKGDGNAYEPTFVDPLHQGTEFVLLEDRSGWYRARFTDGRSGWLPASAAEMVLPRR